MQHHSDNLWTLCDTLMVSVAKNSFSNCRHCHKSIKQTELRVGKIYQHTDSFVAIEWFHLLCVGQPPLGIDYVDIIQPKDFAPRHVKALQLWLSSSTLQDPEPLFDGVSPAALMKDWTDDMELKGTRVA